MIRSPNFLIFIADQLPGTLFPDGPATWLHTPNLDHLAEQSARFSNAYTASPLCAPARASFMSGQLPSRTGVFDNAAEFPSAIPTFAHHLRSAGYQTCLSGKMHFVGPDQLHGYEERLTTDIYPADFGWTPDYRKPEERIDWWYHNMGSVKSAGVAEVTHQLEYDDEVAFFAMQKIYDLARNADRRPWMLTISFSHPHDPYVARRKHWDLYADCKHLQPDIPAYPYERHDQHSKRILDANDWRTYKVSEEEISRARRAYFANISYLDEKIGEILHVLEASRQQSNTVIIFLSDHGDMLGERGLWFKMHFFEGSSCVPMIIHGDGIQPGRVETPVSAMDIALTISEIANLDLAAVRPWIDGESLIPVLEGRERTTPVRIEYAAEASCAPLVGLRTEKYKFVHCELDPPLLFDLENDPHETRNLASASNCSALVNEFSNMIRTLWDLQAYDAAVRTSQAQRLVVHNALKGGTYFPWDFQPLQKASERYMRNHLNLSDFEEKQRFPKGE